MATKKVQKLVWRDASFVPRRLQPVVERTLARIFEENGGEDEMARKFVELSRPKNSPTHDLFEWDDAKAADLYRRTRASQIIRSLDVVFEGSSAPAVRAFPNVKIDGKKQYRPMAQVLSDEQLTMQLVEKAESEARSWRARHLALREVARLSPIFEAIEGALQTEETRKAG